MTELEITLWATCVGAAVGFIFSIAGNFFTHWLQSGSTRKEAERQHLDESLRHLYGPVVRLLTEAQMRFDLNREIHKEYTAHFNQPWHESARERVHQQAEATIQTANIYISMIEQHVDEIVNILSAGWHLIDLADMDVFNDIRRERARIRVEHDSLTGKQIPFEMRQKLGDLSFYKSEWVSAIKSSYDKKMAKYRSLSGLDK